MNRIVLTIVACICFLSAFAQTFQAVESVEYDPSQNRWLAANGNSIIAIASTGQLSFFGNATASHGMEVMGGNLFAISNNVIKAYDLASATELMSLSIPGVAFLNGMTNDGTNIYVTDFSNSRIYKIDVSDLNNPVWQLLVSNTGGTPNGILYDAGNNRLIYVNWGGSAAINAVDLANNTVSTIINNTGLGNLDGIDDDAAGNYYVSSWSPDRITKYDNNFQNPEIITTPSINNPADIGYSQEIDKLAIPVGNDVVFVCFNPTACPFDVTVNTDFNSGDMSTIVAENSINATSTIPSGATIVFDAGVQICMTSGFVVEAGADFMTMSDGCVNLREEETEDK